MLKVLCVLPTLLLASQLAHAAPADGPAIQAAIAGNTVQGEMQASGRYTEFYAADGKIHGKDYGGTWTVQDDAMCFKYGEDPAACWQVELDGTAVTWLKDGKVDGRGTIVPGNPNQF